MQTSNENFNDTKQNTCILHYLQKETPVSPETPVFLEKLFFYGD